MKLAAMAAALGIISTIAVTPTHGTHAQGGLGWKALVYIATVAGATYWGIREADAAKKQEETKHPSNPGPKPSVQAPVSGTVYRMASGGYCISYISGACSPCSWNGSFCAINSQQIILFDPSKLR